MPRQVCLRHTSLWNLKYPELLQADCETIANLELAVVGVITTEIGK